jgi:hypothetical protein
MIIRRYKEIIEYIKMFKNQNTDILIIMSKAGLAKTSLLKEIMGNSNYTYISTHSTPLKTYLNLFEKRDCPVVFDDLDSIFSSSIMTSLLKALADTSPIKELHYNTTSSLLGNAPESFKTTSNCCILLNEFNVNNANLKPIIDRGFFIEFCPSKKEIMDKIRKIAKSQNIAKSEKCVLEFLEQNYEKVDNLSLRTYVKALQLYKDDNKNWKEKFMQMIGFDEKVIEYIKLREKYSTVEEMVKNYKWSRATFFRVRSEVEK